KLLQVSDVRLSVDGPAYHRDDAGDDLLVRLVVDVRAHDARALLRETPGGCRPDSLRGARDDCHLAVEPTHDGSPLSCRAESPRALRNCSASRQAEDALGDDVALDLRRAAGDRLRKRAEIEMRPRELVGGIAGAVDGHRGRTYRLERRERERLRGLTPEELEDRVLRRGPSPRVLREAAVAEKFERLRVDVVGRHAVAQYRPAPALAGLVHQL